MVQYSNPKIPEGINTSKTHPLREFAVLGTALVITVLVVVLAFGWLGTQAAQFVPFSTEQALMQDVDLRQMGFTTANELSENDQAIQSYLQQLADQLAIAQSLPEEMNITVHYVDSSMVNALATLGGHIVIFQGLLDIMPNENALAMVVAHEIAHVSERHPIRVLGRNVAAGIALATLTGFSDGARIDGFISNTSLLSELSFSRQQERDADAIALETLAKHYGHVQDAEYFFVYALEEFSSDQLEINFLSTHPLTKERIVALKKLAIENNWEQQGKITTLPDFNK